MKITRIRRRPLWSGSPSDQRRAAARSKTLRRTISPGSKERITGLIVDVGNRASAWRGAAGDAELAYRSWKTAPLEQRDDSAAAYLAAIEREEKAAAEYRRSLDACWSAVP
jgi:hypothetical protein